MLNRPSFIDGLLLPLLKVLVDVRSVDDVYAGFDELRQVSLAFEQGLQHSLDPIPAILARNWATVAKSSARICGCRADSARRSVAIMPIGPSWTAGSGRKRGSGLATTSSTSRPTARANGWRTTRYPQRHDHRRRATTGPVVAGTSPVRHLASARAHAGCD